MSFAQCADGFRYCPVPIDASCGYSVRAGQLISATRPMGDRPVVGVDVASLGLAMSSEVVFHLLARVARWVSSSLVSVFPKMPVEAISGIKVFSTSRTPLGVIDLANLCFRAISDQSGIVGWRFR